MFLQGSLGIGKAFTVKALINAPQACGKTYLICDTTGIAAVQYPGGTTLCSLFRLGIDEEPTRSFHSNIGCGTLLARYTLAADLIITDEVSMLTPSVANRVSMTLQSISADYRIEFGRKLILFVGDLLQLPPAVRNVSRPVAYRLITRLPNRPSIQKFQFELPMRARDPLSAAFLLSIAKGQGHETQDWRELTKTFGVTVTKDVEVAQPFLYSGVKLYNPFPLDGQWICATNRLANALDHELQSWRSEEARCLGVVYTFRDLAKPLSNCPGLSEAQQIESIDTPDPRPNEIHIVEEECFILLRTIDTRSGLANGRRCRA